MSYKGDYALHCDQVGTISIHRDRGEGVTDNSPLVKSCRLEQVAFKIGDQTPDPT